MRRPAILAFSVALIASLAACGDDTSNDDTGNDVGAMDAGSSDAGGEDAGGEDAGGEDAGSEDAGGEDAGSEDAGDSGGGTPDAGGDVGTDASTDASDAGGWDVGELPPGLRPTGDEFIVVVLPDTQIYAQRFPETFDSQIRWIVDHAEEYNIVFVTHVGDIVQTAGNQNEWDVARAAYDWLDDIGMPYGFSIGGHDTSWGIQGEYDNSCSPFPRTDCDSLDFKRHFGAEFYEGEDWFGGSSPSGLSSYQRISVGDMDLLFLHMPQDTPEPEVEWASEILDANPGVLAHLTTHRYLFDYRLTEILPVPLSALPAGRFNALTYQLGGQSLMYNDGLPSDQLFARLISRHPNIWGVHCGHVDAEFWQSTPNSADLPVYEVLVDYQDMSDGGGGWLRLLKFSPSNDEIQVISFSTTTGELRGNGDGFEHSLEILDRYKDAYGADLEQFGLDLEDLDELIDQVREPGELRDQYFESLYGAGQRDSFFTLDVDFDAYIEASR